MGLLARALLGRIGRRLAALRADPAGAQAAFLRRFCDAHRETAFGREHGLASVRRPADLARAVPLRRFEGFEPWTSRMLAGEPDALVPGRPRYYGLTTGTTGGQKRIPVTDALLRASSGGFLALLGSALLEGGSVAPLLGKLLVLGATTPLGRAPDGVPEGAMSTIAIKERPFLLRSKILPGNTLDDLPSWDEKLDALAAHTARVDLRIASGMPPWLLAFFDKVVERTGAADVRALWPRLDLVLHAGTFLAPYRARLEERLGARGRPVRFRNMYSATEAVLAIQDGPGEGLLPLADDLLFELVPPETLEGDAPTRLALHEAEVDREYALAITSWTGMAGYVTGDTVRVVSRDPVRLVVSGRTRQRANVAGEKVTMEEVEAVALDATRALGLQLVEMTLVALGPDRSADGRPRHRWLLEVEPRAADPAEGGERWVDALARALDDGLRARSPTYRVRREGERPALGAPEVKVLEPGSYARWLERGGRQGAHHKVQRIVTEGRDELELPG